MGCSSGFCGAPPAPSSGYCCNSCAIEATAQARLKSANAATKPRGFVNRHRNNNLLQSSAKPQIKKVDQPPVKPKSTSCCGDTSNTPTAKATGDLAGDLIDLARDTVKEVGLTTRTALDADQRRRQAEAAAQAEAEAARLKAQQQVSQQTPVNPVNTVQLGPPAEAPQTAPGWTTGEKVAAVGTAVTAVAAAGGLALRFLR